MAKGGLPDPTKAQEALFRKLSDQIGCVVCLFYCRHPDGSRVEGSVTQIHHLVSGTKRISHWHVIPLCKMHHDEGQPGNPSFHSILGNYGKAEFERTYATEMELVIQCEEWINQPYVTGLLSDEQAPQDSEDRDTDSDANGQPDVGDVPMAAQDHERFNTQVRVVVTHRRFRLADPHGASDKWAMDALVRAAVLKDDSTKEISEIVERQEKIPKSEKESTIFEFTEVAAQT